MDGEDESNNERRGLFDPVRDALDEIKSGAKPDFVGNDSGRTSGLGGAKKKASNSEAVDGLRSAEKSAAGGTIGQSSSGIGSAREKETKASGFYSGSGKSSGGKSSVGGKKKAKGWLKKGGPMGLIIALIVGVGGIMGGSQLFQPFSLVAQFQETFNSMHVSANTRSNAFFRMQMDSGRIKNPIKGKIFGADTFKITKKQAARLSQQGIEVDDDFEGSGIRVLKFDDGTGEIRVVAADDASVTKLNDMNLKGFDTDTVKYNAEAVSFKNLYADNTDFFNGYNKGSMTWRGAIANWFGTRTADFLGSNKITRNLFKDFQEKVAAANDGNTKKVATDMIAQRTEDADDVGMKMTGAEEDDGEVDSEGKPVVKDVDAAEIVPDQGNSGATYSGKEESSGSSTYKRSSLKSEADVRTKLDDVAGKVQKGANIACTVLNTVGAINLLVTASEALQIINLTSAFFEAVDKTKAGDGDNSPIHELAESLNEKKTNEHKSLVSSGVAWNDGDQDSNFTDDGLATLTTEKTSTQKTAMESSGIAALYGGGKVDTNDASVQSFNFSGSIKRILGGVGVSMEAFEACALTKIAANAVSAITSAIEIAGCILGAVGATFTFGVSTSACGPLVAKVVKGIALSVAIGVVVAGVISAIVPYVSSMLTRDLVSDIGGEDLGNALTSGGNMYLGNTHRYNGGSLATREEYTEFALAQNQVIAEDAKYERQTKDPFDMTSKYTFMGTLMTQLMSFARATSFTKVVTSSSSVISNSIVALSPTASAYDVVESLPDNMDEYAKTCPYLASIGAIGDAYCNPYSITDLSTINTDPLDVIGKLEDYGSFQEGETGDGNVKIAGDSDLAKYIMYCNQRESAFGVADQNIVSEVSDWGSVRTGNSSIDTATNSAIGAIPIIGDVIDVVSNTEALQNVGYVGGESCVAGNNINETTPLATASPDWDKAKYYQRFIEDQSLAESIGLIEESAVTAFVRDYREDHPLDNSYEGILARYSGLSKDTVVAILDIVEYENYINNYDPTERYAFGVPVVDTEKELKFDNENVIANNFLVVLADKISYADVRNRSFAV